MEKYIREDPRPGEEFGDVDIALLVMNVKALEVPVLYEITQGGSVFSEPIIHKGVFYCACCDHNFYALDAGTGEELWRFPTKGVMSLDAVLCNNTLYFGSYDKNLYALGLDGKLVWKFQTSGPLGLPAVHQGMVYTGSEDGNLYAIDAGTGQGLWRFRTGGAIPSKPLIHKDAIYFGSWDHNFYAISLDGKKLLWKFRCGHTVGGATLYKGVLYFGSFDHNLYAMTPEGELLWKYRASAPIYGISRPIVSDDIIYFGLKDDYMYAVSTKGRLLWKFRTGQMIVTIPAVHKGRLYFGSCDGNFYVLDCRTGQELWRFSTPLPLVAPPVISGNRVYFGGGDCNFYCLTLDGELVWKTPTSLSYPSRVDLEAVSPEPVAELVWHLPEKGKEAGRYKPGEVSLADYGEFSGNYIDIIKASYLGKKKAYV